MLSHESHDVVVRTSRDRAGNGVKSTEDLADWQAAFGTVASSNCFCVGGGFCAYHFRGQAGGDFGARNYGFLFSVQDLRKMAMSLAAPASAAKAVQFLAAINSFCF